MPVQFNPNTMQAVDTSASDAHQAELLEIAIEDASRTQRQVSLEPEPEAVAQAPVAPAPAPEPTREPVPVWSPDDWKRESESFRKKSFGTNETTPQQAVASASAELQSLQNRLAEMERLLQKAQQPTAPIVQGYRAELDPELTQVDPALAQRLEGMSRTFEGTIAQMQQKHEAELAAIRSREEARDAASQQERSAKYKSDWEATLAGLVPDLSEFIPGTPGGIALAQWANRVPEYAGAVNNVTCYNYSPHFLASVMSQFRSVYKGTNGATKTPSIADIANPVLTGSAPAVVQQPVPEGPLLTPQQMATAWDDVQKLLGQGKEGRADELIKAYERTTQAMALKS